MFTRQMLNRKRKRKATSAPARSKTQRKKNNCVVQDSDERRWEDLGMDCLTNVFARVGMESLILCVPFVCKTWHEATLDSLCWQSLYFPDFEPFPLFTHYRSNAHGIESFGPFYDKFALEFRIDKSCFSITAFIKLVVKRSNGKALELKMPGFSTEEALRYVSDACPNLRVLSLPDDLMIFKHSQIIPELIGKWKFLEQLCLGSNLKKIVAHYHRQSILHSYGNLNMSEHFKTLLVLDSHFCHELVLDQILVQVGTHCKHFMGLQIDQGLVGQVEASTIVNLLPNIKYLKVIGSHIERDGIVTLLQGCNRLELLDVNDCEGFEQGDEEISKFIIASRTEFQCEGKAEYGPSSQYFWRNKILNRLQSKCRLIWVSAGTLDPPGMKTSPYIVLRRPGRFRAQMTQTIESLISNIDQQTLAFRSAQFQFSVLL